MRKYVILAVILMAVVLSYFYFQLGGVSNIKKSIETVDSYQLIATSFKGKYNGRQLEGIFHQARTLGDQLVIVNYPLLGDSTEDGYVHQLIGAQVGEVSKDIPIGFEVQELTISRVIRATIDAHNLVMPQPKEIEEALRIFGMEQNLTLEGYTIERYISDRELVVEIPVIE